MARNATYLTINLELNTVHTVYAYSSSSSTVAVAVKVITRDMFHFIKTLKKGKRHSIHLTVR